MKLHPPHSHSQSRPILACMLPRWVLAPGIIATRSGAASATKPLQHASRHQTVFVSLANELACSAWRFQTDHAFPSFCLFSLRLSLKDLIPQKRPLRRRTGIGTCKEFYHRGHRGISYTSEGRITTNWLGKVCIIYECGTGNLSSCKPQLWMKDAKLKSLFA